MPITPPQGSNLHAGSQSIEDVRSGIIQDFGYDLRPEIALRRGGFDVSAGVYVGAVNRVGREAPWNIGEFYGQSYFVNPGQIEAIASRDHDELLIHDMDFGMIREVRNTWQFFRDRRPETYDRLTEIG